MNAIHTSSSENRAFKAEKSPEAGILTIIKIQKCALLTFAILATLAGIGLVGASIAGVITWPVALLAIPLFIAAAPAYVGAMQLLFMEIMIKEPF